MMGAIGRRVVGLLWLVTAAGCAAPATAPPSRPQPTAEIELTFLPAGGTRLTYTVNTALTLSGDGVRALPAEQRRRTTVHRKVIAIVRSDPGSFDARLTEGDRTFPATLRFRRNWVLEEVIPDESGFGEAERAAARGLPDLFKAQSAYYRRWRVGEISVWTADIATASQQRSRVAGTIAFLGLVEFEGRRTAHFYAYSKAVAPEGAVQSEGESWIDTETGILLVSRTRSVQPLAGTGARGQLESVVEERLDPAQSRLAPRETR
jgi:hypothetical protein